MMLIGYARISKSDGSQSLDLQRDALTVAGVKEANIYTDQASGSLDERPGLDACLKALREGDVLVVWKLDRLGRSLRHLINTVCDLGDRGIGFKVLDGALAGVDTTTTAGKMLLSVFAGCAEAELEMIRERTNAGLSTARAHGRVGGRRHALSKAQVRLVQAAMGKPETNVSELAAEVGVSRHTLYKYVSPDGQLRDRGRAVLGK